MAGPGRVRETAGKPTGGQFAPVPHAQSQANLETDSDFVPLEDLRRNAQAAVGRAVGSISDNQDLRSLGKIRTSFPHAGLAEAEHQIRVLQAELADREPPPPPDKIKIGLDALTGFRNQDLGETPIAGVAVRSCAALRTCLAELRSEEIQQVRTHDWAFPHDSYARAVDAVNGIEQQLAVKMPPSMVDKPLRERFKMTTGLPPAKLPPVHPYMHETIPLRDRFKGRSGLPTLPLPPTARRLAPNNT